MKIMRKINAARNKSLFGDTWPFSQAMSRSLFLSQSWSGFLFWSHHWHGSSSKSIWFSNEL